MPALATAAAGGRCLRCHGDTTTSDCPLCPVATGQAVKERVKHCALNLVNVEVGVPVHH